LKGEKYQICEGSGNLNPEESGSDMPESHQHCARRQQIAEHSLTFAKLVKNI
jgi:hypothetical protein